jgi:signal transduction histidine kinase
MFSMTTSLRIALLSGLLALVANVAIVGFISYRTHDAAVETLRLQVAGQSAVLDDVYHSGGISQLANAIDDMVDTDDPQVVAAVLDPSGRPLIGNVAKMDRFTKGVEAGYRIMLLRLTDDPTPHEAAIMLQRLPGGRWLLSGRTAGDGLAVRQTLATSLWFSLALSVLLGLVCGLITARYVDNRVRKIATVADRISGGDLDQRVPVSGTGDAFDGLGRQINLMLDRIGRLMSELRMLTDSLAHDLRSPVGRLRAAAEAAIVTVDSGERDQLLGNVIRQADSLMRILTTVLEIGRSEALTSRNQFSLFDPATFGDELGDMYEPVAEEAGMTFELEIGTDLQPFFGHRQLLAQAVSNLIDNALKYAASGCDIRLIVRQDDKRLRIGVADRGPGIEEAQHSEARKRFGRLDSSRSTGGAGLGLALVEAIAHLHDGALVLEDHSPGLIAWIDLPREKRPPPATVATIGEEDARAPSTKPERKRRAKKASA